MKRNYMINGALQKCSKRQGRSYKKSTRKVKEEDYTQRLPDEIITSCMLPRLPLQALVVTSALSRRWRNMCKYSISRRFFFIVEYDFECNILSDLRRVPAGRRRSHIPRDVRSYIPLVNCMLKSYPHSTMDEFTLRLPLSQKHSSDIDGWLQFAFTKGSKRIELEALPFSKDGFCDPHYIYVFPDVKKLSEWLLVDNSNNLNRIKNPVDSSALTSYNNRLTDLQLRNVKISQASISFILSSCPFLECLSIHRSTVSADLQVVGTSLRLRSLEIIYCNGLTSIEISAPNLSLFKFNGPGVYHRDFTMSLKHVPRLSEMFIAGIHTSNVMQDFPQHYSYISQLETLTLQLSECALKESISSFTLEFPKLNKLKHLEVIMHVFSCSHCLLWPTCLIKAAPYMQRFTAKLRYNRRSYLQDEIYEGRELGPGCESLVTPEEDRRRMLKATDHVHESLKVVELIGFIGCPSDLELARHLLSISKSLVKAVFDRSFTKRDVKHDHFHCVRTYWRRYRLSARREAFKLREILPVGAELVII